MSEDTYYSHPLTPDDDLDPFDCGVESLNGWLKQHALRAQAQDVTRTFVWTEFHSSRAVAYHSMSPTQVVRTDVTAGLAGGNAVIPAFLIGRLALDKSLHGQGLGSQLLIDALWKVCSASQYGGGRLIVVDPIDDVAAAFYARHDFQRVQGSARMYAKIAAVRAAIGFDE